MAILMIKDSAYYSRMSTLYNCMTQMESVTTDLVGSVDKILTDPGICTILSTPHLLNTLQRIVSIFKIVGPKPPATCGSC